MHPYSSREIGHMQGAENKRFLSVPQLGHTNASLELEVHSEKLLEKKSELSFWWGKKKKREGKKGRQLDSGCRFAKALWCVL